MKDFYQIDILIGLHLGLKQRLCKTKKKRVSIELELHQLERVPYFQLARE